MRIKPRIFFTYLESSILAHKANILLQLLCPGYSIAPALDEFLLLESKSQLLSQPSMCDILRFPAPTRGFFGHVLYTCRPKILTKLRSHSLNVQTAISTILETSGSIYGVIFQINWLRLPSLFCVKPRKHRSRSTSLLRSL